MPRARSEGIVLVLRNSPARRTVVQFTARYRLVSDSNRERTCYATLADLRRCVFFDPLAISRTGHTVLQTGLRVPRLSVSNA